MKKIILTIVSLIFPIITYADPVEIDGIYYNLIIKGKAAEVTNNPNLYTGSVVIPETVTYEDTEYSVTSIGYHAFGQCRELTSVTIPNSITSIGNDAFYNCESLTSITIPNSIISIGKLSFFGCYNLASVCINDLEAWLNISFDGFSSNPLEYAHKLILNGVEVKDLMIPNNITSIGNYTFIGCNGISSVTIHNGVNSIGDGTFANCEGLTSIVIPNSVKSIGEYAFRYCENLTSINLPNSLSIISEGAFCGCRSLASITIPTSITDIRESAFYRCSSLASVNIPDGVTSIGGGTFSDCSSLTTVVLGKSIKKIGKVNKAGSFSSCPELTDVFCFAENVPEVQLNTYEGSYIEYATLHVPENSVDKYNAVEPWKNFKSIVAIGSSDIPEPEKCATPTISYANGELTFHSATEGAEYVYEITDTDIKKGYEASVHLTATYTISVYAMKVGYDNSDVATATLCWIDQQPQMEGFGDAPTMMTQIPATPVLIQTHDDVVSISGAPQGTDITIYNTNGQMVGSGKATEGTTDISTPLHNGNIAIVKIGDKSVKVMAK